MEVSAPSNQAVLTNTNTQSSPRQPPQPEAVTPVETTTSNVPQAGERVGSIVNTTA